MKTVVVGVFDQLTDAGRVIAQLAASPLDMDSVQVVHAQAQVQERLSAEAGLPPRRAAVSTLLAGAALGALAGFWAGGGFAGAGEDAAAAAMLPGLGPLPGLALGLVLGAALGLLAALFGERTEIPERHRDGLLQALQEGATVLTVSTESLPTARAIGDLFRAGGSRLLEVPAEEEASGQRASTVHGARTAATGDAPDPATPPESHEAFVPPWRRSGGAEETTEAAGQEATQGAGPSAAAAAGDAAAAAFTLFPEAGVAAPHASDAGASGGQPSDRDTPARPRRGLRHGDVVTGPDTSSRPLQVAELTPLPSSSTAAIARAASSGDAAASAPPLEALGLPARVVRALHAAQVRDTTALRRMAAEDPRALDLIPGVGPMAQKQIRTALGLPEAGAGPDA